MTGQRSATWKWGVCGLLLLATMLLYMDRQTLAQTITDISNELGLNNRQYGRLEFGFGIAFAVGAMTMGVIVDKVGAFWLYPIVLIGWSLAGVATAYATEIGTQLGILLRPLLGPEGDWLPGYLNSSSGEGSLKDPLLTGRGFLGLMTCRVVLGFFEAGHWPCALVTTQRILSRQELPLGNSILQSGASIGAILTPIVVLVMDTKMPGSWRLPFQVIGYTGLLWIVPWFLMIRPSDLARPAALPASTSNPNSPVVDSGRSLFLRRFLVCLVVVIMINLTWQFFRAWLPKFLREFHHYEKETVNYFTSAYYIAADVGCIGVGALVRWLTARGQDVHRARVFTFFLCALLTSLSFVIAGLPRGPLLMTLLLLVAAGSLGFFPNYYAFTQDLSRYNQGKVTGTLGAVTWVASALMQVSVGEALDRDKSYFAAITMAGVAPLIALAVLLLFWDSPGKKGEPT